METIRAIILGLVQGLTEFIPVSSSGHLILVEAWLNFKAEGFLFDISLNVGTLTALIFYFRRDLNRLVKSLWRPKGDYLAWYIAAATIPAAIAGVLLQDLAETSFRSAPLVATNLVVVAVLMLVVDRTDSKQSLKDVSLGKAILVGIAQALALIPGVSRSGITIVAARKLGLNREASARLAFLMAIPITLAATLKVLLGVSGDTVRADVGLLAAGVLSAAISGFIAIHFMLKYLQRHSLSVFAWYRLAIGLILLMAIALN